MESAAFNVLNYQAVDSQKTENWSQDLMLTFLVPAQHLLPLGIMQVFIPALSLSFSFFIFLNLIRC